MATKTDNRILKRLSELEKKGGLPLLLQFYREIVLVHEAARKRIGAPEISLTAEAIRKRTEQGFPLLGYDDFNLDLEAVRDVFVRVIDVFSRYPGLFGEIPETLKKPGAEHLLTTRAIRAWFNGEKLPPALAAGISQALMGVIIQLTLKPWLAAYARTLIDSVKQERWRRSYCPVCGGRPDFAFLDRERGARWLLCSRCDSEWIFQRIECPYCGTRDRSALSFFTDEKELYRLNVCARCRGYLKIIDLRKTDDEVLLPLERLMTGEMDTRARREGYRLPA
ncbi:MAG TPA: formate dehydrogenase accessory protein FdhE [Dehalococcoidales bacterium]|nr:formate dehydrogenase accessory protein FdhE [Dehalococcoidales bacterium]